MPEQTLTDQINALPQPLRQYIHDLEARCDPAGDVQTIASLREQLAAAHRQLQESQLDHSD